MWVCRRRCPAYACKANVWHSYCRADAGKSHDFFLTLEYIRMCCMFMAVNIEQTHRFILSALAVSIEYKNIFYIYFSFYFSIKERFPRTRIECATRITATNTARLHTKDDTYSCAAMPIDEKKVKKQHQMLQFKFPASYTNTELFTSITIRLTTHTRIYDYI